MTGIMSLEKATFLIILLVCYYEAISGMSVLTTPYQTSTTEDITTTPEPPTTPTIPTTTLASCLYEGEVYPAGADFYPYPCLYCYCPDDGGEPFCNPGSCYPAHCVDSTQRGLYCCETCPNGPNCYAGSEIISAGQDVILNDMVCRCPDVEPWGRSSQLEAVCHRQTTIPPETTVIPTTITTELITPAGCEYEGKMYPPGVFRSSPCEHCECPPEGGQMICALSLCLKPQCVNSVTEPEKCCPTCPNGPNCYAGSEIISAGQDVILNDMVCRCPDVEPWGRSSQLEAVCHRQTTIPPETTVIPTTITTELITPAGCEYEGKMYPPGVFRSSPCEHCECPPEGGQMICALSLCLELQCVNSVTEPEKCCPTCPNGPNCYAGSEIISAGQDVILNDMVCRCPDVEPWGRSSQLEAVCHPQATIPPETTVIPTTITTELTTPAGCEYEGKMYPPGVFRPSPCDHCECPPEGGQMICAFPLCLEPQCVDSVTEPEKCCPTCPNGFNCYAGSKIIPVGVTAKINGMVCRCPDPDSLSNNRLEAVCERQTTTAPPGCEYEGVIYPAGDFAPSPCASCHCCPQEAGVTCNFTDCLIPQCVDPVTHPGECCSSCPNGPNCYYGSEIVPAGEYFIRDGKMCRCPENRDEAGSHPLTRRAVCEEPPTTTPAPVDC